MMQSMRNSAKIIFFIVLVAFAGFMILQGLMSLFIDPTQGGKIAPQGVIGIINGAEITVTEFENNYRPKAQALFQNDDDGEPTDEELSRIRDEVWSQITTITNLRLEATRHGIIVSDAEVAEYMRLTPPQDLIALPDFQTDEKFDIAKYRSWLRNAATSPNRELIFFLSNFESQIRQQVLIARLQSLVASMVKVTKSEAKENFIKKNEKTKVKYIFIPQDDFSSEEIIIPEADILARYEADKESYKRPEQAVISYVKFPKQPGEDDYKENLNLADSLYNAAKEGADFAELAKQFSEDTGSGKKGGDLGWFGEGRMVKPFWEATIALDKIGDISKPIRSQFGWHIIKLTGRRETDDPNTPDDTSDKKAEYQASHILIKVEMSNNTLAELEVKANNFVQDAITNGFKESAEDFGLDATQSKPFSDGGFIPGLGPLQEASDFAFNSKPGNVSDVISTRNEFMVAVLDQINPESFTPLDEVRERLTKTLERDKRVDLAFEQAGTYAEEIKNGSSLEDIAESAGKTVLEPDYFARHEFIQKVGSDAEFIGAAFRLSPENRFSDAVRSTSGAYILEFVDFQPADTPQFTAKADSLTQDLISTKRQEAWSRWVNSLMKDAEIEDYRSFYYGG